MANEKFPRPGAWAVWTKPDGDPVLGVVRRVGLEDVEQVTEPHPVTGQPQAVNKTVYRTGQPFLEFHTVKVTNGENHGETDQEFKNVPFDQVRQATYAEMRTARKSEEVTPLYAHRRGYDVGDELRAQIPDMEREEALQIARATAVAEHPDIAAIDQQRTREMAALEAKFAQLYAQAAATIDPDAEITKKIQARAERVMQAAMVSISAATGQPSAAFRPASSPSTDTPPATPPAAGG